MKRIDIYISVILTFVLISGCKQSFLNTQDVTQKTTANFYQSPSDAEQALTAIYSSYCSAIDPNNGGSIFLLSEQMSDESFSGGGQHDNQGAIDQWQESKNDQYENTWKNYYQGIFRANNLINYIGQVTGWDNADQKNQIDGEAHFMRAMNYFDLMRLFGGPVKGKMMGVPLITDPAKPTSVRASVDSVYALIASDLKFAIDNMPSVGYHQLEPGHATKWAAEALMARVFLFYNGQAYGRTYSSSATMPLTGGGTVKNADVVKWIDDCIANSGNSVEPTFGDLWPYSYKSPDSTNTYPYARNNNLSWVGDDGSAGGNNPEAVFQIVYSTFGGWNNNQSTSYDNSIDLFQGVRLQGTLPFGYGWGFCTVSPTVFTSNKWFASGDIRKKASVWDVNDASEGVTPSYQAGGDLWEETGYWQKKYIPINVKAPASAGASGNMWNYSHEIYPTLTYNTQTDNTQNLILIRYSDVLLMAAELGSPNALTYLNEVHAHSGLGQLSSASLANIQQERRAELAFEGVRYWDELRYGTMASDLQAENGVTIWNAGTQTTYKPNITRFKETQGFLPIPGTEIDLSSGELQQNDGWTSSDGDRIYQGN
ncbi:MAG TPA: RagB/SusD family nutrient uptake outer membrane protein [Balneolales bacterium]|nr:RagB/SusD family nutrient uptake outer membrane protein [Balneolales bacterium]